MYSVEPLLLITQIILILLILRMNISSTQETPAMYHLNPEFQKATDNPYLTSDLPKSQSSNISSGLTFCSWISLTYFNRPTVVLSIKDVDTDKWQVSLAFVPNNIFLKIKDSVTTVSSEVPLVSWNHLCLSISSSKISFYLGGKSMYSTVITDTTFLGNSLKVFTGGGEAWPDIQTKTIASNKVDTESSLPKGSFAGRIFPILYENAITVNSIKKLRNCENITGSALTSSWILVGKNITMVNSKYLNVTCMEENFDYFLLPEASTFEGNRNLCHQLNLKMLNPTETSDSKRIFEDIKSMQSSCSKEPWYSWILPGSTNSLKEITDMNKCQALTMSGKETISCHISLCSGCQITSPRKQFILRGLCSFKEADLRFIITKNLFTDGYSFLGLQKYFIEQDNRRWLLNDRATGVTIASAFNLIGVSEWTIERPFCSRGINETVKLSFTACESNEAICSNGECISSSKRCNSFPDCHDGSDEYNCDTLLIPPGYFAEFPPEPSPSKIKLTLNIIRVLSAPPQELFTLLMETELTWVEGRIQFANLRRDANSLISNHKLLWKPKLSVFFPNIQRTLDLTELESDDRSLIPSKRKEVNLWVSPSGEPLVDLHLSPYQDIIFDGSNTTFTLSELITLKLDCQFDFTFFPFDEHLCQVTFILSPWSMEHIEIDERSLLVRYTGPQKLLRYSVRNTKMEKTSIQIGSTTISGVILSMYLVRQNALYVFSIYFPSILLVILNCLTLWMTGQNGETIRLQVSCLVCIIFMMLWIILEVTSSAYGSLTAIHVWLWYCTFHSLLHLTIHVLMDVFYKQAESDPFTTMVGSRVTSSKIRELKPSIDPNNFYNGFFNKLREEETHEIWTAPYWILFISRIVSPALIVIFILSYWPFVLNYSKK